MKLADIRIRDPFVRRDGDRLILYGSTPLGWQDGGNCFVAYTSGDMEEWEGPTVVFQPDEAFWGVRDFWAPEVHVHDGACYLLASFMGTAGKRGTAILRADSLLGPFRPYGAQRITPPDMQCLDGTLHIENGRPYMVFCHEWVECGDGGMYAVPLAPDLSGPDGAPVELFHASEAKWCRPLDRSRFSFPADAPDAFVTDGPWLFTGRDGGLKMLWSSFSEGGYTVGLAMSDGGVLGPWRQAEQPVLAEDGGHCMLFTDLNGQLRMSLHQPNRSPLERARFLPVELTDHGIRVIR